MQSAYPDVAAVTVELATFGLTAPATITQIVDGVISDFEQRTGYVPFLGASAAITAEFDPPNLEPDFILDLQGGFWTVTTVAIDGHELTLNEGYGLLPANAVDEPRGWNKIRFLMHPGSLKHSIAVTGKRGWGEQIPDDVYTALLDEMVRKCVLRSGTAGLALTGSEVKQGGFTIKGGGSSGGVASPMLTEWETSYKAAIMKYARM